jgi:drug/metabolite transporter (DMT)-like permease
MNTVRRDFLILCFISVLWSAAFFMVKDLRASFSDAGATMLRFSLIAAGLWVALAFRGYRRVFRVVLPQRPHHWLWGLALGFFGNGPAYVLYFRAMAETLGTEATVLSTSSPIVLALLGALLLRERLTALAWTGLVVGFVGMYGVVTHGWSPMDLGALQSPGNLLIVVGLLLESLATVLAKPLVVRYSGLGVVTLTMTGTALFGAFATVLLGDPVVVGPVTPAAIVKLGYLTLLCGLVLFPTWYWVMERLPIGLMGISLFVLAPSAALIGFLFYGDVVHPVVWQGTVLILLAIWLSTRTTRAQPRPEPSASGGSTPGTET